jgi:hypothetical protein
MQFIDRVAGVMVATLRTPRRLRRGLASFHRDGGGCQGILWAGCMIPGYGRTGGRLSVGVSVVVLGVDMGLVSLSVRPRSELHG